MRFSVLSALLCVILVCLILCALAIPVRWAMAAVFPSLPGHPAFFWTAGIAGALALVAAVVYIMVRLGERMTRSTAPGPVEWRSPSHDLPMKFLCQEPQTARNLERILGGRTPGRSEH